MPDYLSLEPQQNRCCSFYLSPRCLSRSKLVFRFDSIYIDLDLWKSIDSWSEILEVVDGLCETCSQMTRDRGGTARSGPRTKKGNSTGLKELAEYLGLAPATISLVMNGAAVADTIAQETRDLIYEGARKLNYKPNFLARSLRAQLHHWRDGAGGKPGVQRHGAERNRRSPPAGRILLFRRQSSLPAGSGRRIPADVPASFL